MNRTRMTRSYINEIGSDQLHGAFLAGARRIIVHQKLLNDINVFPVPDADTGTNLSATMRALQDVPRPVGDVRLTAVALADAAMTGARGNSGLIFAQFLYGFGNEMPQAGTLHTHTFALSMKRAVAYAYEAISTPVEGTILTVISEWAAALQTLSETVGDFIPLLSEAFQRAEESLAATTEKLEPLARAHVVDAGAKGFVFFLEGMLAYFASGGESEVNVKQDEPTAPAIMPVIPHEEITRRYCTEAVLSGDLPDKSVIGERIASLGDSLVIGGTPGKLHVHLHTDEPAEMISRLQQIGMVTYQKVDDMVFQREVREHRKADIALLTDSGCDLPQEMLERYQIHVIPFTLHFGETFFLDRITLMPLEFYARLKSSPIRPTTSQPSVREFVNRYEYLLDQYQSVIAIHFSENLTGTFATSQKAAQEVSRRTGKRIDVVNSASLTGGEGLLVLRVAQAIEEGKAHDEIVKLAQQWKSKIVLRVGFDSLRYIVQGGRVSPLKGFITKIVDLKPAIAITLEGKPKVLSLSLSVKGSLRKVLKNITREINGKPVWGYAITHTREQGAVDDYIRKMEQLTGMKPLFVEHSTPAIVANTGTGICITVMLE